MTHPRVVLVAAMASVASLVPVAMVPPAQADEQAIGLSRDGTHWFSTLQAPLFDPRVRWVPGDVRTARFYVRNQRTDRGDLTVDVQRVRRDQLLETGWLEISARAGARPWSSVTSGGLQELLDTDDLASGDPVAVDVRVRMADDAPNGTMVLSTDLDFRVRLQESTAGPGGKGGSLPQTGSAIAPWLPPFALGLVLTGTWLVVRRRREQDDAACTDLEQGRLLP